MTNFDLNLLTDRRKIDKPVRSRNVPRTIAKGLRIFFNVIFRFIFAPARYPIWPRFTGRQRDMLIRWNDAVEISKMNSLFCDQRAPKLQKNGLDGGNLAKQKVEYCINDHGAYTQRAT